jgi:hypothetical protein
MFPSVQDNNMDGQSDNLDLNAAEIATLRANALNVAGVEVDPPGIFNPGRFNAEILPDMKPRNKQFPGYLDLAAARTTWDKKNEMGTMEAQLNGVIPRDHEEYDVWFPVDQDNDPKTGAQEEELQKIIGVDVQPGVEVLAQVRVQERKLISRAWQWDGEQLRELPDLIRPQLLTMRLHPYVAPLALKSDEVILPKPPPDADLYDIIRAQGAGPVPNKPFRLEPLIVLQGRLLDSLLVEKEPVFELVDATFPHCFPDGDGQVGEDVPVKFDGLEPFAGKPFHALLGPNLVATGTINDDGTGLVDLPIPPGTKPGLHLVTIGPDGAALTADCTLNVIDEFACKGDTDGNGVVDGRDVGNVAFDFGRDDCPVADQER